MKLAIGIVNWNTRDRLARCLTSIEKHADPASGFTVDTWVVDNASRDHSAAMVREQFPWARLIVNEENLGYARACNQVISQSSGRYLLLLNSDTELLPGAIPELARFMEENGQAGACGPRLLDPDGTLQASCHPMLTPERELWRLLFLDRLLPRATYPMHRWELDEPRRVETLNGASLFLRRAALEAVGHFDENYFFYTEEVDLCYRLDQAGWELWWVPQATVVHEGAASSRQVEGAAYLQLYRSKVQFYRNFGGERRARRFKHYLCLVHWPRLIVARVLGPLLPRGRRRAQLFRDLLSELPRM